MLQISVVKPLNGGDFQILANSKQREKQPQQPNNHPDPQNEPSMEFDDITF